MTVRAAFIVFSVLLSLSTPSLAEGVSAAYPGATSANDKGEAVPYPQAGYTDSKGATVPYPPHPVITPSPLPSVVCTQDAKICPDGTAVSRVGPKCEFAACPARGR